MPDAMARTLPSATALADAVFKTLVEGAVLIVLSVALLTMTVPTVAAVVAVILLVIGSLAADHYLFGSIGRAFAARRALDFKSSPLMVAAVLLFLLLPVDGESDKIVRFALAAGIGAVVTGLLNLGKGRRADA